MMNEETKAALNEFLKKREERIKNMTLAEARDIVSRTYGHSDMRMESDKALQMLLDCADKALEQQPKTGHWIYTSQRRLVDETDDGGVYITDYKCTCSECGGDFGFQKMSDAYCKYCGAKMVEPRESEDEE